MNGDLWVGTLSGLYQYDDEKESFRHIPFTADKGIDIFQFDKDNKLWILMDGNLIRFNTEDSQFRIFAPEDNQSYTSFCITRENSIWIGSSDGLISLLNPEDETMESYNVFATHPRTRHGNFPCYIPLLRLIAFTSLSSMTT